MGFNLQDPAFLIPVGVIILSLVLLLWALSKLFQKAPDADDLPFAEDSYISAPGKDLFGAPPAPDEAPPAEVSEPPAPPPARSSPAANREMAARLDGMTQKLSDMQTVLQRQSSVPAGAALAPETIDKLLKIISNVTQQVDILQKSLASATVNAPTQSIPAQTSAPTPVPVPAPAPAAATPPPQVIPTSAASSAPQIIPTSAATPPPANPPAGNPASAKPLSTPRGTPPAGAKSVGVAGGALSSFGKAAPKPGAAPEPPTPNK